MTQPNSLENARRARSFQAKSIARPDRSLRLAVASGVLLVALGSALPARADIWGYVDETGRAHMASEKLDSRYTLFYKGTKKVGGPEMAKAAQSSAPAPAAPVATAVALVDTAAEAFRNSAQFKRTTAQANVEKFEPLIHEAATLHKVDPALVKAVVAVESSFQPDAVSPKGARGLMQVIPPTAERYGIVSDKKRSAEQKLLDPATNLKVGAQHLAMLMTMFSSNLELVLAAYNAGEGAVLKYAKKIPPFRETQEYVKKVQQFYAGFGPTKKEKAEPKPVQLAQAASAKMIEWSKAPAAQAPVVVPAGLVVPAAYIPNAAATTATPVIPASMGATAAQQGSPADAAAHGSSGTTAPAATESSGPLPVFRPITTDQHEPKPESVLAIS